MNVSVSFGELISGFWSCTTQHAGHICFREKLESLRLETATLQRLRSNLTRKIESADRENELMHNLEFWLSNIVPVETEVVQLTDAATQELANTCLGSLCPRNLWSRYKIGKKIEGILAQVVGLTNDGKALLAAPVERTEDRILKCLAGQMGSIVGIHGKGGVGKTAVLTEISNNILGSSLGFDFIIWVLVSQDVNLEKIQACIGREVGFLEDRWKDMTGEERAAEILKALQRKKFLLMLDDIWERVDLSKIGVPSPSRENDSKVVFTTRTEAVCNEMGAEEKIEVCGLTKRRALELFRDKVGLQTLGVHPEIARLAGTIAELCDGLPLALITLGRAMASKKTVQEWRIAVDVLKKSVSDISGGKDPVFALIKFCYDCLPSEIVKCCFLYCTLFPEDFSINKFDLIDYWIGEGFLDTRDEGYKIISLLIDSCLVEDEEKDVKLHDLIREVALWIASEFGKFQNKYIVEAGARLAEPPEIGRWERSRRISLMANHIRNLTSAPRCKELLTLLLGNNGLKTIVNSFFQFVPSLKVLDLSENRELLELPSGISKIESLQYLNLSKTGIRQLPTELKKLVKLKCMNLEYTYELQTIPLNLISSFTDLNVLRMVHCASSDRVTGDGIRIGGHESFVRDLEHLEHLNALSITIRHQSMLESLASIEKFRVCTQALSLKYFKYSRVLDVSFLEGMRSLEDLEVIDCLNLSELRFEQTRNRRFDSLRKVLVVNCSKLVELTWLAFAPSLEILTVSRCNKMEVIISLEKLGGLSADLFTKLEVLHLVSAPELKSIYRINLQFQCLKEVVVDDCPKLRKLPLSSDSTRGNRIVIRGWESWWQNLEWDDEVTRRIFQHSFKACRY